MYVFLSMQHSLYIVVDTSSLLAHLELVTRYLEVPIEGVCQPVFLVPWEVLLELEALHEHVDGRVLERVKKAVQFLQNVLTSKHHRFLIELFEEVCMHALIYLAVLVCACLY